MSTEVAIGLSMAYLLPIAATLWHVWWQHDLQKRVDAGEVAEHGVG